MNAGYRTIPSPPPWSAGYPARSPRPVRRLRRRRDMRVHSSEPGSTESTPPNARPAWAAPAVVPPSVGVAVAVTLGPGREGDITTVGGPLGRGFLPRVGVPLGQPKPKRHGGLLARGFFGAGSL